MISVCNCICDWTESIQTRFSFNLPELPTICEKYPSDILDLSSFKLQQPDGNTVFDLLEYDSPYFYTGEELDFSYIIFDTPTEGETTKNAKTTRTELRETYEWNPIHGDHLFSVTLKVSEETDTDRVIVSQIHNTNGPTGAPFMHTRWENGLLKLHYKKNAKGDRGPSVLLGSPNYDWFTVTYDFSDGQLQVMYNEQIKFERDISYWDVDGTYVKGGSYSQENTSGKHSVVYLKELFLLHD
jgi:hypothetical protein